MYNSHNIKKFEEVQEEVWHEPDVDYEEHVPLYKQEPDKKDGLSP